MKKVHYIGARFTAEENRSFVEICETLNLSHSETLRIAVLGVIRKFKQQKSKLTLPYMSEELLAVKPKRKKI